METLNTFFHTKKASLDWATSITNSPEFTQAKHRIAQELTGAILPETFYERMIMKLTDALDIDVGNILVWGWRKQREIVQYRDKENPPSGSHTVPLLEHSLVSKHSPTIQPVVNEVRLPKLKFDIILKLKLKGAILNIQDGKIMQVTTGTCTGSGSIAYTGIPILERSTAPLNLPGSIVFTDGFPI
ncbi:MAG: hypothetical protein JSV61_16310 [Anaerolineales bacterium]|nr:MAG: hypothetical protein JSV61_16310 [Anaerolineales bacterium]